MRFSLVLAPPLCYFANMHYKKPCKTKPFHAVVASLLSVLVLTNSCKSSPESKSDETTPVDTHNPELLQAIAREGLEKIGFSKILEIAEEAGVIRKQG